MYSTLSALEAVSSSWIFRLMENLLMFIIKIIIVVLLVHSAATCFLYIVLYGFCSKVMYVCVLKGIKEERNFLIL